MSFLEAPGFRDAGLERLVRKQFENGLREIHPSVAEEYAKGNFLVFRLHRKLYLPQTFWQVAGQPAKDIQKHLHDIVATIEPEVIEKFQQGHEIVIRVPQRGLGYAIWSTPERDRRWF